LPTFKVHHAKGSKTVWDFAEQFAGFNSSKIMFEKKTTVINSGSKTSLLASYLRALLQ